MKRNSGIIHNFFQIFKKLKKLEFSILINVYMIITISLIWDNSAKYVEGISFVNKEIVWTLAGTFIFIIISLINYK